MFDKHARISIRFRDKTNAESEAYFPRFCEELNAISGSDKFSKLFVLSKAEMQAIDKSKSMDIPFEERDRFSVYFVTRKAVDDYTTFERLLKLLKEWMANKNERISVEIVANFIKMPLYLRDGKFQPSRTFYDLGLVRPEDAKLIDEINKIIE